MSPLLQSPLTVEHALLGFVRDQPLHGYEIYRRLHETPDLRLIWRVKQSRLYALLSRLEDEGLIHATLEPQDRRPPRKVYCLSPAGESAFRRWLTEPVGLPREVRLEFMLKLYFAVQQEPAIVALLIERQQAVCARWLDTQASEDALQPYTRAVRRYRRSHIEAIRDWLARLPAEWLEEEQPVN
jgi:DNA-binding PadR family transcriptional regulator